MENSRNKQFISFKLHAILSNVTKSCDVALSCAQDTNHPLVQCIHTVGAPCPLITQQPSRLSGQLQRYHSVCVPITRISVNKATFTPLTTAYYYTCFILAVIVNLILYPTCKLNLIVGIYVQEKAQLGFSTLPGFMHTLGVLEHTPCGQGGLLYLLRELDSLPYIQDVLGLFFFFLL